MAADRYLAIYQVTGDPYPGTNAASLYLLSGDKRQARRIASDVRSRDEGVGFYPAVSRAECALILGEVDVAETELLALRLIGTRAQRLTARQQLNRTIVALNYETAILNPLDPQYVACYVGHLPSDRFIANEKAIERGIVEYLEKVNIGIGYGSLAAGADIVFAECLLARGAELNVVLPFPPEDFIRTSVEGRLGDQWEIRFQRCLSAATNVWTVSRFELGDPLLFGYGSMISAGLAKLAKTLGRAGSAMCSLGWKDKHRRLWDGQ